jgi:DNA modification methylase
MILHGDCFEQLKTLPDNSIDSIVTDPPYGLSFMGKKWDYDVPSVAIWKECLRVLKPGGHLLSFGGTRTYHRLVVNIEDAGFEIRDCIQWLYGSGFPKSHNIKEGDFKGYGTALKPANEPICVARKPLEKGLTVAENVQKYGTGAINIDASRIGTEKIEKGRAGRGIAESSSYHNGLKPTETKEFVEGRWPANIILDEEAAQVLDEQSGVLKSGKLNQANIKADNNKYGQHDKYNNPKVFEADSGGASRLFYVAKASKRERNAGLDGVVKEKQGARPNSADASGKFPDHDHRQTGGNNHPTVKPVKLMEYLIKLVTPPNGTVLDPFMGSGSTGVAAKQLGFKFVGCEMNKEYFQIAEKRYNSTLEL